MDGHSVSPPTIRFGVFEFDPRSRELRKQGMKIKLQGQPAEILAVLLERPGQVITREELQKRLWPADTFVDFEHSLNAAIKRLRAALGDSADSPRFVETLSRRGYRFIAPLIQPVETQPVDDAPQPAAQSSKPAPRPWSVPLVAGFLLVVAIALGFSLRETLRGRAVASPIRSLAVLPLANLSGDPDQDYFVDGMADALRQHLEGIRALRVISRTSSVHYRGSSKPLPEIARELNVEGVVEGSVLRSGDRVRITVQLIQVSSNS